MVLFAKTDDVTRFALLQNPIIQHVKHTYSSFRKLPDLLYFPYWFVKDDIPVYHLSIPIDNIGRMNDALPNAPMSGKLEEENKLYVKATFGDLVDGYRDRVDIKYRGVNALHWNTQKKSYRIKFPDENLWRGQRLVTFIIPYDRAYYNTPLNMYRAKKLGLISLDMHFARLVINGKDAGVYLVFEHWSPELLAKKGLPESKIFGNKDGDLHQALVPSDYVNILDKESDNFNEEIATLLKVRDETDKDTFKTLISQIVDLDKLYAWNVLTILAGSSHQSEDVNAILYFNNVTGKFEIIPWDVNVGMIGEEPFDERFSKLVQRVLSVPEFREARNKVLREYIDNPENLAKELAFYDALVDKVNTAFLKDNTKRFTNFRYLADVRVYRETITNNFEKAAQTLDLEYTYRPDSAPEDIAFSGSFSDLPELVRSLGEFLRAHPQFFAIDRSTVGISGTHVLRDDVILPSNIALKIRAGTNLYLDSNVSIYVRGPLTAIGSPNAPITILRLDTHKPWGTLAVINAQDTSTLSHVHISGGSGALTNGIIITGMLAFHSSDVSIDHATFVDSSDDDALNVKSATVHLTNSSFHDTFSDAVDIDFASTGSVIISNTFTNVGGDTIDISFSNISITDNVINTCVDKGISVGEVSTPKIMDNTITKCDIGIAVKDLSAALIENNTLSNNTFGISLYKKKPEFGGATAQIGENVFEKNMENITKDEYSEYSYTYEH